MTASKIRTVQCHLVHRCASCAKPYWFSPDWQNSEVRCPWCGVAQLIGPNR